MLGIDQSNPATDMDGNGQVNIFDLVNASRLFGKIYGADAIEPTVVSSSPLANLSSGVTSTILFAKTDERATCKYANFSSGNYSVNMTTFAITGRVSHSTTLTGLTNGTLYNYYVQCQDEAGNLNSTNYNISFGVNSGSDEPTYNAGMDTLITEDGFGNFATIDDRHAARFTGPTSGGQTVGFVAIGPPIDYDRYQIIAGRDGTGLALRATYLATNGSQQTTTWSTSRTPPTIDTNSTMVVQMYIRVQSDWSPGTGGTKWMEFWFPGNGSSGRMQTGFFSGTEENPLPAWHWSSHPSGPPYSQDIFPRAGSFQWLDINNGNWYRHTWQYKPASELLVSDGVFRYWINGVKVIDLSTTGVTEGYSNLTEVQSLPNLSVLSLAFPDVLVDSVNPGGTIDYDDFTWWVENST